MSEVFDKFYNSTTSAMVAPNTNQSASQTAHTESNHGPAEAIARKSTQMDFKDVFLSRKSSLPCEMKHLSDLKVELGNEALWRIFHAEEHEMKITNTGRPLFPVLMLKLSGLSPTEKYSVSVNFTNVDSARYRYSPTKNEWHRWSTTEPDTTATIGQRLYEHPSSPALGAIWTTQMVTFDKLRVTNDLNRTDKHMIQVSGLRKYRIQVIVIKLDCSHCHQPHVRMVELPLTEFVAVTGYRNNKITQLKIEKNPSSIAFRDDYKTIRASRKRKLDACHASKKLKLNDVITKPDITRSCSWEECSRTSCCKTSPDTSTTYSPSIDLGDHVTTFLQNDVILHQPLHQPLHQFHQPLNPFQGMEQLILDIPQFQIPEINTQYSRMVLPGFQPQEQYTYDCDFQSYCHKYEDFATPFQYTEWDTLYY